MGPADGVWPPAAAAGVVGAWFILTHFVGLGLGLSSQASHVYTRLHTAGLPSRVYSISLRDYNGDVLL